MTNYYSVVRGRKGWLQPPVDVRKPHSFYPHYWVELGPWPSGAHTRIYQHGSEDRVVSAVNGSCHGGVLLNKNRHVMLHGQRVEETRHIL